MKTEKQSTRPVTSSTVVFHAQHVHRRRTASARAGAAATMRVDSPVGENLPATALPTVAFASNFFCFCFVFQGTQLVSRLAEAELVYMYYKLMHKTQKISWS